MKLHHVRCSLDAIRICFKWKCTGKQEHLKINGLSFQNKNLEKAY